MFRRRRIDTHAADRIFGAGYRAWMRVQMADVRIVVHFLIAIEFSSATLHLPIMGRSMGLWRDVFHLEFRDEYRSRG
jgi:hypothetical protein